MNKRIFIIGALLVAALLPGGAQSVPEVVQRFLGHELMRPASISIRVVDLESGDAILDYQSQRSLIPASTLKVLTTGAALELLGPDFRYETRLEVDGPINADGTLEGNLYITGSGDPTLGAPEFEATPSLEALLAEWRLAIQQAGIRRISGRIIGDGTHFPTQSLGRGYPWADIGNYYAGGVYGLNIHENLYFLFFQQQNQLGATPPVEGTFPSVPGIVFENELQTAGRNTGDRAYIFGAPYTYQRFIRGTIPAGSGRFTIKGALPEPPLQAAQLLRRELETVGLLVDRPSATARMLPPDNQRRRVIHRHYSPPMSAIVERTNQKSVNLYSEALLRTVGKALAVDTTDLLAGAVRALENYWKTRGIDMRGVQLVDGSGLSARNLVTTQFMVDLLRYYRNDAVFRASLPVAGRNGTLAYSFRRTAAVGRVQAKTGSINRVRGLAGYLEAQSGRQCAFAILVNNYDGSSRIARQLMDNLVVSLVSTL